MKTMNLSLITLFLCFFVSFSSAALYIFTTEGELAVSTNDGANWTWLTTPLPSSDCVDITSDPYHALIVLTRTGEIYRSINGGSSWESRGNIPVPDACALWAITGLTFVVTESGDFYQRSADSTWSLLGNVGASDVVDLVPKPANGWLVITRRGDVWDVIRDSFSASLVGNIGSSSVVGATSLTSSVIAVTEEGDIVRSVNNGVNWSWISSVSQLSITGFANKSNNIYVTTHCGEIARSTNQGSNWTWQGSASQIGVKGITSDTLTLIGIGDSSAIEALQILGVHPNPSRGRFTVRFMASETGDGRLRIFDILGRDLGTLWQGTISSGINLLDLEKDAQGVYFLILESDKATATTKLILQ